MKKSLLFTTGMVCLTIVQLNAQVLANGDFETWLPPAQGCTSPGSWNTLNSNTAILGICTSERETSNVHGGTSALKMSTALIGFPINQIAPGLVTNGTIVTTGGGGVTGGVAFTERPTGFKGWYLASPVGGDNYSFGAIFMDANGATIGTSEWSGTATVGTYTMFDAPIVWTSAINPTTLQIILLPSDDVNPVVGSTFTVDDLGYYTDPMVGTLEYENDLIGLYPNPANDNVFFNLGNEQAVDVSLFDVLGCKVSQSRLGLAKKSIATSELANGTYFWQVSNLNGELLKSGKVILAH
jgi:hypothetical protein